MDYKGILMDVGKNALAVGVVEMVNIVDKVPVQRTEMTNRLKQGATYTLARDLVGFMTTGRSDVLEMNYRHLIDSTVWNGASGYMADRTGLTNTAEGALSNFSPLERQFNEMLVDGSIMTLSNVLRDYAETSPSIMNTPLKYVLNPTSLWY